MIKNSKGPAEQGSAPQLPPVAPTIDQVRGYVKDDIARALNLLDSVYRDVNTMNALADFLHGRLMNAYNAEALKKQTELELN